MKNITGSLKEYGMIIALVVIAIFFQITTNGILFRPLNITNLVLQNGYILVLAVGMVLVIVTGKIDLSVGSVAGFIGSIAGVMMVDNGWPVWLAVLISLVVGCIVGAWHGYWIAYRKIPAFIVTLAGMLVFRGLTMFTLGGRTIAPFPSSFQVISTGFVTEISAFVFSIVFSLVYISLQIRNLSIEKKYGVEPKHPFIFWGRIAIIVAVINVFGYWFSAANGVPYVLLLLSAIVVFYHYISRNTVVGRHIYATGGNEKAAELSGIKTKRVVMFVYINMGFLAALAGLLFAARLNAATPQAGIMFELDAIAAAFIGGASAMGGVGKVTGAIIGAMVMGILNNGMSIMGIGVDIQQVIAGLVLLAAVVFDVTTKSKG